MAYWETIIAKLSIDQLEILDKFKKENGIKNNNQLLKLALEELIGVNIADSSDVRNSPIPKEYLTAYTFYEFLLTTFKNNFKITHLIEKQFKDWQETYFKNYSEMQNIKLVKANQMWKAFKEKKKVGRPKDPKRKAGRPIDTGK